MKDICISDVIEVDVNRSTFDRICYICDAKFSEPWNKHVYNFHGFYFLDEISMVQNNNHIFDKCQGCQELVLADPQAANNGGRGWIHVEQRQRVIR